MKAIIILMDSLNRNYLEPYGNKWVKTPNISKFAEESTVFENHWLGSSPCMPARRDIMTGKLEFPWRGWGPIEPFDETLQNKLDSNNIFSHLVTDHYHYFEIGGENYHTQFNTWELIRGQEIDPWVSKVKPPTKPEHLGRLWQQYLLNKSKFNKEEDYPSPKTFRKAIEWIGNNKDADDYLLWVESFDPHEPFDTPQKYLDLYEDDWDGPLYFWSAYDKIQEDKKSISHLRKRYAATITMTDKWFGRLLDALNKHGIKEETLIILTTDHGHLLGEHSYTGKNFTPVYNELAHLPLIVHFPSGKYSGKRISYLTQNIDIMPTILDYFNISQPNGLHGISWFDMLEQERNLRKHLIYGWFGRSINITDGRFTYFKTPCKENRPLYSYSAMPTTLNKFWPKKHFDKIEAGYFLDNINMPVFKIPGSLVMQSSSQKNIQAEDKLYNIIEDYNQEIPLKDKDLHNRFKEILNNYLIKINAPNEQLRRLKLDG